MCPEKQGNYVRLPRYVAEEGVVHPSPVCGSPSGSPAGEAGSVVSHIIYILTHLLHLLMFSPDVPSPLSVVAIPVCDYLPTSQICLPRNRALDGRSQLAPFV